MKHVGQLLFLGCRNSPSIEDPSSISRSKLYDLPSSKILAEVNPVSSKLLEDRQAEMRDRLAKNNKKRQIQPLKLKVEEQHSLSDSEAESVSDSARGRNAIIVEQSDGSRTVTRQDLYTLI
jgi:hypothetical protein